MSKRRKKRSKKRNHLNKKKELDNRLLQKSQKLSQYKLFIILLVAVAAIVIIVYWPALTSQALTLDDELYLTNLSSEPGWELTQKIITEVTKPSVVRGYYQPLPLISLIIDSALGGRVDNLFVFHCTNLILHLLNVVLIIIFIYLLFGNIWLAVLIGLLFGIHPVTIESVAWVIERKTLLASFFSMLSLIFYVRYTQNSLKRLFWSSQIAFLFALLSKPTAVSLPLLMLLLDWWPLKRLSWKTFWEKTFYYIFAITLGLIALFSQESTNSILQADIISFEPFSFLKIPLLLGYNTIFYLSKILWPGNQTLFYSNPEPFSIINPDLLIYIIPACILFISILILLRWTKVPLVSWLFFIIALLPASGIVQFTSTLTADRHLYLLPFLGFFLFLGWILNYFWNKFFRKKIYQVIPVMLVFLFLISGEVFTTRTYLSHWKDSEGLARYFISITPQNYQIHGSLGEALYKKGKLDEAIACYKTAISLNPDYAGGYNNIGIMYREQGKINEAIYYFIMNDELRSGRKK